MSRAGRGRRRAVAPFGMGRRGIRPGDTHPDPFRQVVDHRLGQLSLRRHLDRRVISDRLDERALLGPARHHDRPGVAPLEYAIPGVEPQARFLLLRAVATPAMLGQDRPDSGLEELDLLRGGRPSRSPSSGLRAVRVIGRRSNRPGQGQSGREKPEDPHAGWPSVGPIATRVRPRADPLFPIIGILCPTPTTVASFDAICVSGRPKLGSFREIRTRRPASLGSSKRRPPKAITQAQGHFHGVGCDQGPMTVRFASFDFVVLGFSSLRHPLRSLAWRTLNPPGRPVILDYRNSRTDLRGRDLEIWRSGQSRLNL